MTHNSISAGERGEILRPYILITTHYYYYYYFTNDLLLQLSQFCFSVCFKINDYFVGITVFSTKGIMNP